MAGFIPSFLSAAKCMIRIGDKTIAYAQNISISDDMSVIPVGMIGAYGMQALEPSNYIARGSMTITHYSDLVLGQLNAASDKKEDNMPTNLKGKFIDGGPTDGNSLLSREHFSPVNLLLSRTFDLDFYEKSPNDIIATGADKGKVVFTEGVILYRLQNVRMTTYNIGFTPGSLVNETVGFMATGLLDSRAGEINKQE